MAKPYSEQNLSKRVKEIYYLANIIDDLINYKKEIKNFGEKRSALHDVILSFLITIWETYLEDIIKESIEFILKKCNEPTSLPYNILLPISEELIQRKDKREIWKISGNNWKITYKEFSYKLLESFNTPRPSNIDILFEKTIGYKKISSQWKWRGANNASIKRKINYWINRRGEIIHQIVTPNNIHWHQVIDLTSVIARCSRITSNRVRTHLYEVTGSYPWDLVRYGSSI